MDPACFALEAPILNNWTQIQDPLPIETDQVNPDDPLWKELRAEYEEYPNDIVPRLLNCASVMSLTAYWAAALMCKAAKTIDDLRNGRGG